MKKLLFIVFILGFSFSQAQISFEKGYFISNSGDRTQCLIKNMDWKDNPTKFEYKINPDDSESTTATIASVAEFGIDDISKYKRFKINIERSSNDLQDISKTKNPVWKEEVLFLKVLIEGDATLFSFSDKNIYKYFYETKKSPIEQLIRIKYISYEKNPGESFYDDSIRENNQFRQQLYNNLKCDALPENLFENTKYDKSSLMNVFEKYNSCVGSNTVTNYKEKAKKDAFNIKITPSINQTAALFIDDPSVYYNLGTTIEAKTIFKIGAEFEYILPFNNNIWSIFTNPTYQKYNAEQTYINNDGFGNQGVDITHNVVVDHSSLEIPIGIRYYVFLNKTAKIFINAAFVKNIIGKSKFNFDDGDQILESSARSNYLFGVGYNFKKKFSAELRFNTAKNLLSDYFYWEANYSSFGIIFGYRIF